MGSLRKPFNRGGIFEEVNRIMWGLALRVFEIGTEIGWHIPRSKDCEVLRFLKPWQVKVLEFHWDIIEGRTDPFSHHFHLAQNSVTRGGHLSSRSDRLHPLAGVWTSPSCSASCLFSRSSCSSRDCSSSTEKKGRKKLQIHKILEPCTCKLT